MNRTSSKRDAILLVKAGACVLFMKSREVRSIAGYFKNFRVLIELIGHFVPINADVFAFIVQTVGAVVQSFR